MSRWKLSLLVLFCAVFGHDGTAQVTASPKLSLSMDQASYQPGSSAIITVSLSGSAGTNVSAVQFDLQATGVTFTAANVQISGPQAGKGTASFNRSPQELFCLVIGDIGGALNNLPLADGVIATIPVLIGTPQAPGVLTINLSQTDGAAPMPDGTSVEVPVTGQSISFTILASPCDLNKDGKIDAADVGLAANALAINQPGSTGFAWSLVKVFQVLQAAIGGKCVLQ